MGYIEVDIIIKQPKSDTKSIQKSKSIAIFIPIPMLNIPTTPDDAFNLDQTRLRATSSVLYEIADIYLSICKKKNI